MSNPLYVWISRWSDFQHYKPERDRPPAWIKAYTKQLDDDAYLELTGTQRAVLHDLRSAFARSHGKLTADTRRLSGRIGLKVTRGTLERLNHAGFIELLSIETLDQRLDNLYGISSPHARPRGRREGDEPEETERQNQPTNQANEASYDAPAETANNGHGWQAEVDEEGDHDIDLDTAPPDFDYATILKDMPE